MLEKSQPKKKGTQKNQITYCLTVGAYWDQFENYADVTSDLIEVDKLNDL